MKIEAVFADLSSCDAVLSCDIDRRGALVRLIDAGGVRFVETGGRRDPLPEFARNARDLRCIDDGILLWPTVQGSTLLLDGSVRPGPRCDPREFFATPSYVFGAYGEEDILTGPDDSGADDLITAFDRGGTRVLGAANLLGSRKQDPAFIELTRGATRGDALFFVADGSPHIWRLAPGDRSLTALLLASPVMVADHICAVLLTSDQVGLVSSLPDGLSAQWYRSADGALAGETLVSATPLQVQRHGAMGWHLRAVADGAAITWDRQRAVLLSA